MKGEAREHAPHRTDQGLGVTSEEEPGRLDRRALQTRAVSGALWTIVHVVVSLPLAFVINILVARVLGVADYGRLAYLTMVMEIVGVVVMVGVGAGLIQFGAKAHSVGDRTTVRALLRRTQGFRLVVGAPILTLVVLLLADVPTSLLVLAVVFGIWVPAGFGGAPAALTIQNDTAQAARLAMVMNIVMQGVVVLTVLTLATPDAVWSARLVVTGLGVIAAIFLVQPQYRKAVLTPRWPSGMPAGFWRFAVPMGVSGIVATIALSRSEVVILEHLSTAQQVGLYAMAFGLAGHLFAPAQALLNPLTPAVSALREVDLQAIRGAFRRTTRLATVLAGFIMAVGGPVLAILVPTLYGEAFADAQGLVLALVVVSGFLIVTYPMQAFVTARLRSASVLGLDSMSLVATLAVALALIPWVGAWGAVFGKAAVVGVRVAWLGWREVESFEVSRWEYAKSYRAVAAASVVAAGAFALGSVVTSLASSALIGAVASLSIGCIAYLVSLVALAAGLEEGDVRAIQRSLPAPARTIATTLLRLITVRPDA